MTIEHRFLKLKKKHKALEEQIKTLQRSPGSDSLKITELKKKKLSLKQQLMKLQNCNPMNVGVIPEKILENLEENPESVSDVPVLSNDVDKNQIAA